MHFPFILRIYFSPVFLHNLHIRKSHLFIKTNKKIDPVGWWRATFRRALAAGHCALTPLLFSRAQPTLASCSAGELGALSAPQWVNWIPPPPPRHESVALARPSPHFPGGDRPLPAARRTPLSGRPAWGAEGCVLAENWFLDAEGWACPAWVQRRQWVSSKCGSGWPWHWRNLQYCLIILKVRERCRVYGIVGQMEVFWGWVGGWPWN